MTRSDRSPINRREFVKRTALGAIGTGVALGAGSLAPGQEGAPEAADQPVRKGDMVYRRLGRTNLMVSELAVGGSPSPDPAVFTDALDRGMNLVDTSAAYSGGEERIGEVVAGRREQVVISTKCHPHRMEDPKNQVVAACETALGKLKTDYLDIWCVHGVGNPELFLNEEVQAAFAQLREQGKIRFAGVSCHSDPANILPPLIQSGKLDVVLLAFNVFSGTTVTNEDVKAGKVYENWLADSGLQGVLDLAKQNDIGVVAMKTMAGGARQKLDEYQTGDTTLAQAKIKWVLSHEAVAAALSEVLSYEILEENLGAVGQSLTPEDQAMLYDHVRERSASVCRMCGTCQRACPANVPIPDILRCITYRDLHRKPEYAQAVYRQSVSGDLLAGCGDCSLCAQTCPHGLDIAGQLRYAHGVFA
jgi:predicted aldo/keto reductase-like oxidoreductase